MWRLQLPACERLGACIHVMEALFSPEAQPAWLTVIFTPHSISAAAPGGGGAMGVRVHVYAFFFLFSCLLTPLPSLFSFPHLKTFICHLHSVSAYLLAIFPSVPLYFLPPSLSPSLPWADWATAALSVRIWIIEVYWVWSADGEMAVMDPLALFRNHRARADTCPVKARGVLLKLGSQRESRARHALKRKTVQVLTAPALVHTYICRCRHAMATRRSL